MLRVALFREATEVADNQVEDLLVSAQSFLSQGQSLQTRTIHMSSMPDANRKARTFGFVTSVEFQPKGQLLLTCGRDRRFHLFNIDGVENPKLQTVYFEDMKVKRAAFGPMGDQVRLLQGLAILIHFLLLSVTL